ncbi:HutD family protein [Luteimonas sp. FCS-9]|uniref:HutD/Ves family protein n=1 Tax=Luteimonas sp. FCS-9 TaxID=1547516 RepID=UPI0009E4E4B6|nr:HutD family protein [Luteimonas sp. FCS-9]
MSERHEARVVPAAAAHRVRWRNGHGWTRELVCSPGPASTVAPSAADDPTASWAWRISIAQIDRDAPFSTFPGIDRELVLLRGDGLDLQLDGRRVALSPPDGRHRFAGECDVAARVPAGGVEVFNLMWRRDVFDAQLGHRALAGSLDACADPATTWVLHLLSGQARFRADTGLPPLAPGDTAVLAGTRGVRRYTIEGDGGLIAIRLRTRAPAAPDRTGRRADASPRAGHGPPVRS